MVRKRKQGLAQPSAGLVGRAVAQRGCPECGASQGEPCVSEAGELPGVHGARAALVAGVPAEAAASTD